jgi:hypothetical protein
MEQKHKDIFKASYKPQREAQKDLSKYGYELDPTLSRMDTKVFINKDLGQNPIIVNRGTSNLKDVGTDLMIGLGLGKYTKRVKDAQRLTKRVEAKHGKADVYGSSLGGYVSEHAGNKGAIYTHNKATAPTDLLKKISSKQTDYKVRGDLISMPSLLQRGGKTKMLKNEYKNKSFLNAHKI